MSVLGQPTSRLLLSLLADVLLRSLGVRFVLLALDSGLGPASHHLPPCALAPQINELSQVPPPVMLLPDDFKASSKIKVNNHLFHRSVVFPFLGEIRKGMAGGQQDGSAGKVTAAKPWEKSSASGTHLVGGEK